MSGNRDDVHPAMIARLWAGASRIGARYDADARVMTLSFEDLLTDPATAARAVSEHMGLEFSSAMLAVPQVGSSNTPDAPGKTGINPAMANGWRNGGLNATSIALCEWVACKEMRARGYELVGKGNFPWRALLSLSLLLFKLSIALPLNLSRTKNLRETIQRRFGKDK